MNFKKKLLTLSLAASLATTSLGGISVALADTQHQDTTTATQSTTTATQSTTTPTQDTNNQDTNNQDTNTFNPTEGTNQQPVTNPNNPNGVNDQKNFSTYAVKKVIKFVISHKSLVVDTIKPFVGKRNAKTFANHFTAISSKLKKLLDYEDVPINLVADTVQHVLVDAKISHSSAVAIAEAVKQVLQIFI